MTQPEFIQAIEFTLGERVNRNDLLMPEDENLAKLLLEIWGDARKYSFYNGVLFYNTIKLVCSGSHRDEWCRAKRSLRSCCNTIIDRGSVEGQPEFAGTLAWFLIQKYFPE